jgi:hypothetical protein
MRLDFHGPKPHCPFRLQRRSPNMSDPPIGSDAWRAQDKGPTILAACWAVTALSTVFVGARFYVRGVILKKLHSDDYYSILALVSGSVSCLEVAYNLDDLTLHIDMRPCHGSLVESSSGILRHWKTHCPPYDGAATGCSLIDYSNLLPRHYIA